MSIINVASMRYSVLIGILLASFSTNADLDTEVESIMDHVFVKVVSAIDVYGKRIAYCNGIEADSVNPILDKAKLEALGANREDMLLALAYFSFKNSALCKRDQRLELAFYSGALESIANELEVSTAQVEKYEAQMLISSTLNAAFIFPSAKDIEIEIQYDKLSQQQRAYYESVLAISGPFRLIETATVNGLTSDQ